MNFLKSTSYFLSLCIVLTACKEAGPKTTEESKAIPHHREEITLSYASVVKKVAPAVVNIYAFQEAKVYYPHSPFMDDPFFKQFFDNLNPDESNAQNSLGSGVIVSKDGLILTNYHVIENADVIRIVLSNKQEYVAKLVATDKKTDLALLQIEDGEEFPFLTVGPQEDLEVGDIVLAIGNPFGVGQTVTSGIISALSRSQEGINDYRSFIQTDAAINPGNSGGPLVTTDGQLVGINTAIYSKTGGSMGIGFAIPTSLAIPIMKSIERGGKITRPWLGIEVVPVDNEFAHKLGLSHPYGVIVKGVYPNSPADQAGLKVGDFISFFDGKEIEDDADLDYRVATASLGKKADLVIFRKGVEQKLSLSLQEPFGAKDPHPLLINGKNPFQGASIIDLSPALALEIGISPMSQGVVITDVSEKSPAAQLGIKPGDILLTINKRKILTKNEVVSILKETVLEWTIHLLRGREVVAFRVKE
ncbi:MAG: Do family serine endopeptidase [Alphaproteobacteria bacterium]|nr:Do family serine endopeptidase [Alphaproteobacteria bacterium]